MEATVEYAVAETVAAAFDYGLIDEGIRDEVKAAARSIHQLSAGVMTGIVAIGKRLIEVKGMIPHGQFVDWIVGEFQIEPRMAQNYMNVAREYGDPQKRNIISLFSPTVAYLLAAPSTPEEARVEVEQAALNGQKVTVKLAKKAAAKFTEPKPTKPRAEVKRVAEPYQSPAPTPAKVVYVEPVVNEYPKTLDTPDDLVARGLVIEEYQPNYFRWRGVTEPNVGEIGAGCDSVGDAIRHARRCFEIMETYTPDKIARGLEVLATVATEPDPTLDPIVAQLTSPDTPTWTAAPGGLTWAVTHATLEQLQAALTVLPDALRRGRGPVLEAAIKKLGGASVAKPTPEPVAVESEPEPVKRPGILTREWVIFVLSNYTPASSDFAVALKAAPIDDLREAMASLDTEEKHHVARQKALVARFDELMNPPDPRIAEAQALIALLTAARDGVRADYGRLCGKHLDALGFERDVETMCVRLASLVDILTGKEVTK